MGDNELESSRRPSTYNPFGSFQKRVSIATPDVGRTGTQRRSSSVNPGRQKSITAADLTQQDVAIWYDFEMYV